VSTSSALITLDKTVPLLNIKAFHAMMFVLSECGSGNTIGYFIIHLFFIFALFFVVLCLLFTFFF
jgi:hypothetical protein